MHGYGVDEIKMFHIVFLAIKIVDGINGLILEAFGITIDF